MYEYHLCSNNKCDMVYRGEHRSAETCPLCGSARKNAEGKALRRMYYMPISAWLQHICKTKELFRWVLSIKTVSL